MELQATEGRRPALDSARGCKMEEDLKGLTGRGGCPVVRENMVEAGEEGFSGLQGGASTGPGQAWEELEWAWWGGCGHPGYHCLLSGLPGSHPWTMAPPPGSTPSRTGGFLGTTSPGPMAELYGAANQDSGVSSYISAASPAPSTGFGHSLGVSGQA